jgi:hypothetical protein
MGKSTKKMLTENSLRKIIREEMVTLNERYVSVDWTFNGREAGATANLSNGTVVIDDGREMCAIKMPIRQLLQLADEITRAAGQKGGGKPSSDDETEVFSDRK